MERNLVWIHNFEVHRVASFKEPKDLEAFLVDEAEPAESENAQPARKPKPPSRAKKPSAQNNSSKTA